MDFNAAMETFAEAWVAANTQTAINSDSQTAKQSSLADLPTLVSKEKLMESKSNDMKDTITDSPLKGSPITSPGSSNGTKSLPIHCIIEQITGAPEFRSCVANPANVELDGYAILPGSTPLSELIRSALLKLGYSNADAIGANGAVQLKNWKPLSFDIITDNADTPIEDILGELTQVATLRIKLCSQPKLSTTEEVKEKLLKLLLTHSQSLLTNSECPIEKDLLSSICKGENITEISEELRHTFDRWYKTQLKYTPMVNGKKDYTDCDPSNNDQKPEVSENQNKDIKDVKEENGQDPVQMSYYALTQGRPRLRTSFDPEHEIPRLQKWFKENRHPTRELMMHYLNELNSLESRNGRRKLDLTNIIYWFKNARAAQRRAIKTETDLPYDSDDNFENRHPPPLLPDHMTMAQNRNAFYMIPFPVQPRGYSMPESNEPCDLSQNKRYSHYEDKSEHQAMEEDSTRHDITQSTGSRTPESIKREIPSPTINTYQNESKHNADDVRSTSSEYSCHGEKKPSCDEVAFRLENRDCDMRSTEVKVKADVSPQQNGFDESDCDSVCGDESSTLGDDEDNKDDSPEISSHNSRNGDDDKQEKENHYDSFSTHKSFLQNSLASTPLHIPQIPHPALAMHYYPFNAHFYAQQQQKLQNNINAMNSSNNNVGNQNEHKISSSHQSRKRRTRVFIDPLSEIPKLEKWFMEDTHPSAYMIDKYCEELNRSDYRQKFPSLESKNVQLWFKNHRAKVKRMRLSD